MKRKQMTALFLTAFMTVGLLAGCSNKAQDPKGTDGTEAKTTEGAEQNGNESSEKLVMAWWGNQVRNERTTQALNLYGQENGITVEGQFYQWDDYWNKMATSAAGHSLPDIIQMDYAYIAQYADNGQIIDLTPYIESGVIDTTNIEDSVLETGKVDGKVYGMAAGLSCGCMLYNKTLTDSLGIEIKDNMTLDEFAEIAKKINEQSGYRANLVNSNFFKHWERANGVSIVEAAAPVDSYEPYVGMFQILEDGISEGWHLTPDCIDSSAIETDPLIYGSSPELMAWCTVNGGSNLLKSFQDAAPEGMKIGITTLPTNDPKRSNSLGVSQFFCISSDCKDVEGTAALIDWLINSKECNEILLAERGVPASSTIAEALTPMLDEATVDAMNFVVDVIAVNCSPMDPPAPDGSNELSDTLTKIKEAIGYGEMSAEQGAQEYYNKMIEIWGK